MKITQTEWNGTKHVVNVKFVRHKNATLATSGILTVAPANVFLHQTVQVQIGISHCVHVHEIICRSEF